jgi:hypothetical protein
MAVGSRAFWLPRRGNSPDEYEDAFALEDACGRYALADGASEGCFTGLWARLLVEDFVAHAEGDVGQWAFSLSAIQQRWDIDVRARKLDWDSDYWVEQGAFAAFLGIVLESSPLPPAVGHHVPMVGRMGEGQGVRAFYRWQAVAIGDTCLFHTRDGALLRAFPLEDSHQFNNAPKLVGARASAEEVLHRRLVWPDGRGQPGDRLWLMSDALAQWCLAEQETGRNPWRELECVLLPSPACRTRQDGRGAGGEGSLFAEWIEDLRSTRGLRNDDVTLLPILLEE